QLWAQPCHLPLAPWVLQICSQTTCLRLWPRLAPACAPSPSDAHPDRVARPLTSRSDRRSLGFSSRRHSSRHSRVLQGLNKQVYRKFLERCTEEHLLVGCDCDLRKKSLPI